MLYQPPLPEGYSSLGDEEIADAIMSHKRAFGSRLVILGHHYQRDKVIRFADFVGDSLKLSQVGAQQKSAEFIVFCGVHFMAESTDILTDNSVKVILPDLSAGCSMADMADINQLEEAWDLLPGIVPITYVNSAATIKAFCGEHGGACCTSSNARQVLKWAFTRSDRVLFLPDQHLGRNTAYAMGVPLGDMAVYDPHEPHGGLSRAEMQQPAPGEVKVLLWKGHCSVHMLFTAEQCDDIRRIDPEYRVLVHPECSWDVVQKADMAGSTEFIIKTVTESPEGSKWAIGTETHLVSRLASRFPEKHIRSLAGVQCLCTTMFRIDMKHLLWVLDELADGQVVNRIEVDPEISRLAAIALERMLENVPS